MILAFILATEFIDLDMAMPEKKKTGVYKLTEKERSHLQLWIDNHYEKRSEPMEVTVPKPHPNVALIEVIEEKTIVHLTDESAWEVRPKDAGVAQGWINPGAEILVRESGEEDFPYALTNSVSKSTIRGKNAEKTEN